KYLFRGSRSIQDDDALLLLLCKSQKALPHFFMKSCFFNFHPILLPLIFYPLKANFWIYIKKKCQVRHQSCCDLLAQVLHFFKSQPSSQALIGNRGIGKPIAKDDCAF